MSTAFPLGSQVRLADLHENPYPMFARLLADEPVSWIPEIGMWYVTRRDDVLAVLADTETFTVVSAASLIREAVGHNMLTTDGPEQYRLRRPFIPPFAPRTVRETATQHIDRDAHTLIDNFIGDGETDVKAAFADVLAVQTVTRVLGLPATDTTRIRGWVTNFNRVMSNFHRDPAVSAAGRAANDDFAAFVRDQLAHLRAHPDDSALGTLLHSTDHNLTETELIDACRVIIFGAVETTAALITNTLWALLQHPGQLAQVRDDHTLLPNAIEEALRWESPVQTCTRHLTRVTTINGITLHQGDTLQAMLGAANRDPAHFAAPNTFDIHRANAKDHLAFANGKHYCIGAGLARLEADIALRALFERLPDVYLKNPAHDRPQGYEFRAPARLILTWSH